MAEASQLQTRWSPRSHASFIQELGLRRKLEHVTKLLLFQEKKISQLQNEKAALVKRVQSPDLGADGGFNYVPALEERTNSLVAARDLADAHSKECDALQAAIDALTPTAAQLKARAKTQDQVAQLVAARSERDAAIDKGIEILRRMLAERAELTSQIDKHLAALGMRAGEDQFDGRRAEELAAALPADFSARSESWCAWFLGQRENTKPYIVIDDALLVAETLAHSGVYFFGDTISLTDEEARELLRGDRPSPTKEKSWRIAPPSIATVEQYRALQAQAEQENMTPGAMVAKQRIEREERIRRQAFGLDR